MISYAQNFEDVMLARCFAGQEEGFYVDVGAAHPVEHSVTLHFYERGWHGINIEPVPSFHALLVEARPRDLNLQLAISDTEGEADFFELPGTGLSSLIALEAERGAARGFEVRHLRVATRPLAAVLEEAATRAIDFLKLDIEGAEAAALRSNDWQRFRPRIVIVEAVRPNEPTPTWDEWEPFLLEQGYVFLWFDGLNRFYAARECAELMAPCFATPPNVFDSFQRHLDRKPEHYFGVLCSYAEAVGLSHDRAVYRLLWPRGFDRPAEMEDLALAYRLILGREAEGAGLADWEREIARSKPDVGALIERFVGSEEYGLKRSRALANGRPGSNPLPRRSATIKEGTTFDSSRIISAAYRSLLGREPDPAGLSHYVEALDAGVPIEDLLKSFLSSDEFKGGHRIDPLVQPR